MNRSASPGGAGREARYCGNCGQPLGPDAVFCRSCGARNEPAPPVHGQENPRRSRTAIWSGLAIVLVGAGAALAILLSSGGSASSTTVVVDSDGSTTTETVTTRETTTERREEPPEPPDVPAADTIEAGRYVQAGSFRTVSNARVEQDRLAAAGIDVEVVSSDGAAEFYPGFQVLLIGPVEGEDAEEVMVDLLRSNGVPSAFARDLSPADQIQASEVAGAWSGVLERSSGERPSLNDSLSVTLEMDSDGRSGTLEVAGDGCSETISLVEESETTLTYKQDAPCVSGGALRIRPAGGQLMVTVLPLDSDVLVMGSLTPL